MKKNNQEISDGLVIDALYKTYASRHVVKGISMNVRQNEIVGLLGPNGAGKTTCFSMITGLTTTDSGNLYLHRHNITKLPMYKRAQMGIGYLPQESSIFRGLNVYDNIMAVLELIYPDLEDAEKRLEELLAEFAITHLKYAPSLALSGGERRRLEIARALASNPTFILLDEPLAGVDPVSIRDIKYLISHLKDKNIGILITDHNVREMLEIVDRAYIIYDGKVLMHGTPEEIISHDKVRSVYLGDSFKM